MYYAFRVKIPITVDVMVHSDRELAELCDMLQNTVELLLDMGDMDGEEFDTIDWQLESDEAVVLKLAEWESMIV